MTSAQRVLVIDGLPETEQVLKAILEPRGLEVDRIRSHGPVESRSETPNVVVIHENGPESSGESWPNVPRVIIGTTTLPADGQGTDEHRLRAPFQYGELVQAIERLLSRKAA